jgi:hypothetical protein
MDGLSFVTVPPSMGSDPARADIACFAGFVARRGPVAPRVDFKTEKDYLAQLPLSLRTWFRDNGWEAGRDGRTAEDLVNLANVPVPIASWEMFDALFAWEQREVEPGSKQRSDTLLGAAVRSFFGQGGRNCYVVRLGDPWPVFPPKDGKDAKAGLRIETSFLPRFPEPSPADRSSWKGAGHILGLPDVSVLCLPDLVELFAIAPRKAEAATVEVPREKFVECAEELEVPPGRVLAGIPAPRLDENGFLQWRELVQRIGEFLRLKAREVQFVAAIPLPIEAVSVAGRAGSANLTRAAAAAQWTETAQIETAFVQLVYPWLRTPGAKRLPGGLEPPDGVFAGLLANNALTAGSWRNVIHDPVPGLSDVEPVLDAAALAQKLAGPKTAGRTLRERVTIIGPSPLGFRVLSDVTMDDDETYRPANVNRLTSAIVRSAFVVGETAVFANNGEELWMRLRERMINLLAGLWANGALGGDSAEEAFEVRCDRSTMTQNDLDAGCVICRVTFTAAIPIVRITIVLAMEEGGNISIASREAPAAPQSQAA